MSHALSPTRVRRRQSTPSIDSLNLEIVLRSPAELTPREGNPRKHSARQLKLLGQSIRAFGFVVPVLIRGDVIYAGHARVEAAKTIGLQFVPTIDVSHLTEAEARALALADNKLAEKARWHEVYLREEVQALVSVDLTFSLEATGFEIPEIDLILAGGEAPALDDDVVPPPENGPAVSRPGDLWQTLDRRLRLFCGDALKAESYERLLSGELADLVVSDVPYNVSVTKFAGGMGRVRRREFAQASGEMSPEAFTAFLTEASQRFAAFSRDGSAPGSLS